MDFNQVRYFLALADSLNFTRAAERCYVSQPALTQAIKRLETELGGELIHRDGRNSELTELGHALRGHFEQIDRTRHLVGATAKAVTSGEIAEVNIGIMCTIGPRVIAQLLSDFQLQHPMVSLVLHDVTPESIPDLLLSGAVDGVFCARHSPPDARLSHIDLFEEAMVIMFPPGHPFSEMSSIPLRALTEHYYVERLHCEFRKEIQEFFRQESLELEVVLRSQREDWIQSLVREGVGASVIPRFSILRPELDYRPIVDPILSRTVEFAFAESSVAPALNLLIEHAKSRDWGSLGE